MKQMLAAALVLALSACATPAPGTSTTPPVASGEAAPAYEDADTRLNARLSADPNFGGLYISPPGGDRYVVLFTGADPAAQLARYTNNPRYSARSVQHTEATLIQAQERLGADFQRAGMYFMWSSVDVIGNRVEVEVQNEQDTRAQAAANNIAIPDFVVFRSRNGVVAEAQSLPPVTTFPQARYPAGAEMQALARGRLTLTNGCLRMGESLVIWPSSAVLERDGDRIRIRDQQNGAAIHIDAEIEMGGGQVHDVDENLLTGPIPASCPGPYWIAGTEWRAAR